MPKLAEPYVDKPLEALAKKLSRWRSSNESNTDVIPQRYMDEAAELSRQLPLSRVARRLGLRAGELKRHRDGVPDRPKARRRKSQTRSSATFVEAVVAKPIDVGGSEAEIEISRRDGSRLLIRGANEAALESILRAFLVA